MAIVYILWAILICVEIARNVILIEFKKKRPNYLLSNIGRVVVGGLFWLAFRSALDHDHWICMPFMMAFTFWYLFDYGLNLARNIWGEGTRKIWYINPNGSWLDRLQARTLGGAPTWFVFKIFLAGAGIWLFQNSLNPANYHWLRY